jgi:hypothetical protein
MSKTHIVHCLTTAYRLFKSKLVIHKSLKFVTCLKQAYVIHTALRIVQSIKRAHIKHEPAYHFILSFAQINLYVAYTGIYCQLKHIYVWYTQHFAYSSVRRKSYVIHFALICSGIGYIVRHNMKLAKFHQWMLRVSVIMDQPRALKVENPKTQPYVQKYSNTIRTIL